MASLRRSKATEAISSMDCLVGQCRQKPPRNDNRNMPKSPFYISLRPFLDHTALTHPTDWAQIFGNDHPLEVEIGFGNGEYLARLAGEHPECNFVGFEEYCERIHRTLRKLNRLGIANARVFRLDARPAFAFLFSPRTVRFIHCLFPPPWPKKSDAKHRLFTTEFLHLANSRLMDAGVMKIVTDHAPYVLWIQEHLEGAGFDVGIQKVPAKYDTKFERKWVQGGQREFHEIVLTKIRHIPIPVKEENVLNHYVIKDFDPDHFVFEDFSSDGIAVVFKDFLYDPKRKTALVSVLVHDEHVLQNIRVVIFEAQGTWRIHLAQGTMLMPTAGVAKALECVHRAASKII